VITGHSLGAGVCVCVCVYNAVTGRELALLDGARLNNVQQVRNALKVHKVNVDTTNNVRNDSFTRHRY